MRRALLSLLAFAAAPAAAQQPIYRATLATPAQARMIVKDIAWTCRGGDCTAPRTATSPDGSVCRAVTRKLGRVTGFAAGARTFDAAELEKCNAAAE